MLRLHGLLLDFQLAVDHFHLLVKSFERIDPVLELVDFCPEQLDFLIPRICGGFDCACAGRAANTTPIIIAASITGRIGKVSFLISKAPHRIGNFRMSGQLAVGN